MAQMFRSRRVVFRDCPAEDDVIEFAVENGWIIARRIPEDQSSRTMGEIIWEVDDEARVSYVEEYYSGGCFVVAFASDPNVAQSIASIVEEALDAYSVDELIATVDNSPGRGPQFARAIMRLAIGAPLEYDESVFSRLLIGLKSPVAMDRNITMTATMFTEWPEVLPVLRQAAMTDEDQQVRRQAEDVLSAFANAGIGEP